MTMKVDSAKCDEDPPNLSVVVPVWNTTTSDLLTKQLGPAALEADASFEVIVVDDGSTEPQTRKLLDSLATTRGIRVLHLNHNLGPGGARNAGMAAARGQWVAFLDSDDSCDLTILFRAAKISDPAASDIVVLDYWWLEQGVSTFVASCPAAELDAYDLLNRRPAVWRMIFSRQFLERVPSFPLLRYGEDLCFLLEAATRDPRVSYLAGHAAVTYHCPSPPRSPAPGDREALVDALGRLRRMARTARSRALVDSWALRVIALDLRTRPRAALRSARRYPWPQVEEFVRAVNVTWRSRRH